MRASHADQCTLYFDKTISSLKEFFDNITKKTNTPDFDSPATTDETADGLFSMEDDYGMSYYYRGTAPNNYVKFGQNASGQDMWWRIIRFNGNGTVRMQYDGAGTVGTNTYTRGFALTNQVWNSYYNDAKYLGWMFGGAQGSASTSKAQAQRNETNTEVKTKVDDWYKKNIVDTGYSNYVADAIFCNDRSTPGKSETEWTDDTGLGYGNKNTGYGSIARIAGVFQVAVTQPRFTCPQANDKFTVEKTSGGNGALTYPVGLITADEIVTAGSGRVHIQNSSYYLYKENMYLTFSPHIMGSNGRAYIFVISSGGNLSDYGIVNSNAVAPVINLKTDYLDKFQGNGTIDNPYFLQV